eukprot:NODE_7697_length_1557_cov_5.305594.p1 GENE.NODE_7697_length_1557_cov_5.305594~~NODE_7697_length_1557_cov_5.305594.p1  ORF type:complete len:438 (-),score=76.23 NODE_7697_length_1557_cov_5.305594:242-1486(-)
MWRSCHRVTAHAGIRAGRSSARLARPRCWARVAQVRQFSTDVWDGPMRPRLLALAERVHVQQAPALASLLSAIHGFGNLEADREEFSAQRAAEPDAEVQELYDGEIEALDAQIERHMWLLEVELLRAGVQLKSNSGGPRSSTDARSAVLEVVPGVGGQEAMLFAGEIWEMYRQLAYRRGWHFDVRTVTELSGGRLQSGTAQIDGEPDEDGCAPYGWLRSESGVHRVQRVPTTDRKDRMQTSSAVVVVLPVPDKAEVVLGPGDTRIEISKKSSGPGGQSVNTSSQAIRLVHIPTGIAVKSRSSPSQIENRKRAFEILRTKLFALQMVERSAFNQGERRQYRGTGDRSEKIRTYNFQRDVVVDHILSKQEGTVSGVGGVLAADEGLERILEAHQEKTRYNDLLDSLEAVEKHAAAK